MRFQYIEVLNCRRPSSSKIISGLFWIVIGFLAGKFLDKFLFVTGTVDGISRSFTWKSMEGLKTQGKGKGFLQPMCRDHAASKYRKASHEVQITRSK